MHGRQDGDVAAFFGGGIRNEFDGTGYSDEPGPWFPASYEGQCSRCFAEIGIGDIIRADGEGGWERQGCCGDD